MKLVFSFVCAIFCVSILGTATHAEPTEDDIKAQLTDWLEGQELAVEDIRYKTFVQNDPSVGRVSVAGNLILLGDRGTLVRPESVEAEIVNTLAQKGYSHEEVERGAISVGLKTYMINKTMLGDGVSVYRPTLRKGELIPFSAEMSFMETVDGFNFRGKLDHTLADRSNSDWAMSDLIRNPSIHLVYGGAEYNARLAAIESGAYFNKYTHPKIREKLVEGLLGATLHHYAETAVLARVVDVSYSQDQHSTWQYSSMGGLGSKRAWIGAYERGVVLTIMPNQDMELGYQNFVQAGVKAQINVRVAVPADVASMDEICLLAFSGNNRLCYLDGQIGFHMPKGKNGRYINQYGFLDDRTADKSIVFRVHD
jgi:hypothetical protein